MLIEMKNRGIRPDAILFADTGAERPATYTHVERMKAWARRVGFPEIETVRYDPPIAPYKDLEGECLKNQAMPQLAFGRHGCSVKWKIKPQLKRLKEKGIGARRQAIGLDNGPADLRRAKNFAEKAFDAPGVEFWYPLQEWGFDREASKEIIAREGIEVPIKSCCFFCPGMKKAEIREQAQTDPELHQRALELEANYRDGKNFRHDGTFSKKTGRWSPPTPGLGRGFAWKDVPTSDEDRDTASDAAEAFELT